MRFPEDVPTLTDGEVTLRAHREGDAPRVVEQCQDPDSVRWTTVPSPYDDSEAAKFITDIVPQGWTEDTAYSFALEHGERFAGSIDLRIRGGGEAEVGFGLHPDARGAGVMRRALALILDWGFTRDIEVVHWRAMIGNWDSRRVAWRLGFSFGPTIPRLLPDRGVRRDGWTGWIGRDDPREPVEPWLDAPVLEIGSVRLRPWGEPDAARLVEIANDPVLREWIPEIPLPRSLKDVEGYLTRIRLSAANNGRVAWCVADAASDRALGNISFFEFENEPEHLTAQVGYWSHPDARGRGVMTQSLQAACRWALKPTSEAGLGAHRLYLLTSVRNTPSRALAERVGFAHVGTERGSAPVAGGGFEDSALYDLLR